MSTASGAASGLAPRARTRGGWAFVAHAIGGALVGALEAARLGGSVALAATIVAVFAATGAIAGALVLGASRLARGLGRRAWGLGLGSAIEAAPVLVIAIPVGRTLFDGAYAQTLPGAQLAPIVVPIAIWLVAAAAIAAGRRWWPAARDADDRLGQSIALLVVGGAAGGLIWVSHHVLRSGYADARAGAAFAVIVLVGVLVRVVGRNGRVPAGAAYAIAAILAVAAALACWRGLDAPADRLRLASYGDVSRDVIRVWRGILDFDRDGSSALLGGGDCDDFDSSSHPGAFDIPGDGIDQDCDGADAVAVRPPAPAAPPAPDAVAATDAAERTLTDRTRGMSIVLLSVDALRFDLLAPDAPARADFPRISQLLAESTWFTHAIAPATSTDVSLCTLLSGRLDPYQPIATTLPEALRALGLRTYSAIPGEVTRYVGDVMIGRGVDHPQPIRTDGAVPDVGDHVSAGATTQAGLAALADAAGRPSFIWLHYFDVHEHHQIDVAPALLARVHDASPGDQGRRYRALLHEIDGAIGEFLDGLAARGLADRTIVVFVSDHGENLGDDPRMPITHGQVIYGPLVRVPFAIRIPGVAPAQRTDTVSLVDLAPTLLALIAPAPASALASASALGSAAPPMAPLDGIDLVPAILDQRARRPPSDRAIAIHEELQHGVVVWPLELVVRPADNTTELYDLARDPLCHSDLAAAGERAAEIAQLKARYSQAPDVEVDRTPAGRAKREARAQPPPPRAPASTSAPTPTR